MAICNVDVKFWPNDQYAGYSESTGQVILPVAFMRSAALVSRQPLKGHLDVLSAYVETTKISQSNFPAKEEFVGCLAELWPRSDICKRMGQHAASGTTTSPLNEPSRSVTNDSEQLVAELLDERARNGGAEAACVLGVYGLAEAGFRRHIL